MNPWSPVSNQICMSALSFLIIEKLLFSIRVFFRWTTKTGWVGGQSYWAMSTFSSNAQKYLPVGENKNSHGEEIQTPPSLLIVPVLQKKATRPSKTILKVNTQRTCALHALLPSFSPWVTEIPCSCTPVKLGSCLRDRISCCQMLFFHSNTVVFLFTW